MIVKFKVDNLNTSFTYLKKKLAEYNFAISDIDSIHNVENPLINLPARILLKMSLTEMRRKIIDYYIITVQSDDEVRLLKCIESLYPGILAVVEPGIPTPYSLLRRIIQLEKKVKIKD